MSVRYQKTQDELRRLLAGPTPAQAVPGRVERKKHKIKAEMKERLEYPNGRKKLSWAEMHKPETEEDLKKMQDRAAYARSKKKKPEPKPKGPRKYWPRTKEALEKMRERAAYARSNKKVVEKSPPEPKPRLKPPAPDSGKLSDDEQLADMMRWLKDKPLEYVMFAFPWDTEPSIQLVQLAPQYRERFPKCKYGPDVWACEFLDDLGRQIQERGFDGRTPVSPIRFSTVSGHEIGKDQPYSMELDTPDGRQRWSDIGPGSRLFGRDGRPVTVLARHEQGVRPMYRVSFSDGSSTFCGLDHLWMVRGRQERRKGLPGWRCMTVRELIAAGITRSNGILRSRQWEIPRAASVEYPECAALPLDPYVLGLWLGDGTKANGQITSADPEIWEYLERNWVLSDGYAKGKAYTRTIYGLLPMLRQAGVFGCTSLTARVPRGYMQSADRLAVLQGLLDTDGWVERDGTVAFGSISHGLAEDVLWLARSLGLLARLKSPKQKWYLRAGERVLGRPFHTVSITWDGKTELFRLERKRRLLQLPGGRAQSLWITGAEYSHDERSMCVTVDAQDALYLTNDFIVTHNSAMVAWIIKFIMDTRPGSKGSISAVTDEQLRTKTWAELGKWHHISLTKHWFEYSSSRGAMILRSRNPKYSGTWRCDARTSRREKSEAFAGQHAPMATSFFIFDEASGIFDEVFEVREGSLTSGEPMVFDFGNGTRNSGAFFENCIGKRAKLYTTRSIDSRNVAITNKQKIAEDQEIYGEDSDFFRVRWRGLFPRAGVLQFIPSDVVELACSREMDAQPDTHPLVLGVDVARMGNDHSVIYPRKGRDCRTWKPDVYSGFDDKQLAEAVMRRFKFFEGLNLRPAMIFVDGGGGYGGGVVTRLRENGYPVMEVQPGSTRHSRPKDFWYTSDFLWGQLRDALSGLYLPSRDTDEGQRLYEEMTQREYGFVKGEQIVHLESKKSMRNRGLPSPDMTDAIALTFATEVVKLDDLRFDQQDDDGADYNPYATKGSR